MVSPNVDKILKDALALSDVEREELRTLLAERTARQGVLNNDQQLRKALLAEGLLSHIPAKGKDPDRFRRWQPIANGGKPVSETIIEERR